MMKTFFLPVLLSFFFLIPSASFGQKKFKDSFRNIWVKSLGSSVEQKGTLNYHIPIRWRGDYPVLNKKYESSSYTYVYYVLKTEQTSEKMFSLYNDGDLHSFYTDSIKSIRNHAVDMGLLTSGAIVNFNFYNKGFKRKGEGILYLENVVDSKSDLFEVLVCSNCSDDKLRTQIQTYLAVKYGITLALKDKYYSSDNRKVWDEKLDKAYNNRIMGIARDDYFSLDQQASYSNTDTTFVVSKAKNTGIQPSTNMTYVLAGDNNGEKIFDTKSGIYKRRWLVQNKGEADVKIDLNWKITPDKESEYYLYNSQSTEVQNDLTDTLRLRFKDIEIKRDQYYYFTLEQRKPLKVKVFEDEKGLNKKYFIGINEVGKAPFYITATDSNTQQEYYFVSEGSSYDLESLPNATYAFTVRDVNGHQAELHNIAIDKPTTSLVSMAENWVLEGTKMLEIKPTYATANIDKQLKYEWYFQDKLISSSPRLFVNYSGAFTLVVSDAQGKKEHFGFTVSGNLQKQSALESQWVVSPNPVNRGEEFTVTYSFDSAKKVDFYIYTIDGKFILRKELGMVESASYNYTLQGATTYLIIPIINSKASIQKLIVK